MAMDAAISEGTHRRLAPADRPAGHRGIRGAVAATVALLALVALSAHAWHGQGGGGGSLGAGTFQYRTDGWRPWAAAVFLAIAGALLFAAAILWRARARAAIAFGATVALAAVAAGAQAAVVGQRFATVSTVAVQRARLGTPETTLENRLGAPLTTDASFTTRAGVTEPCLLYRSRQGSYLFCFRDDELVTKTPLDGLP